MRAFETIDHFSALAPRYDLVLCDVWGVVHNGLAAYREACDALARFRAAGGGVILITNAPRPTPWVMRQFDRLGVPRDAYDGVMTSGDVSREVVAARGGAVYHIGPERDLSIFDGIDIRFTDVNAADYAVCTGLFDDTAETPDDYEPLLETMRTRKLFMLCANPDLVVARGDTLVYCAGAVADRYAAKGGEVLYAGKPYRPIYDAALAKAAASRGVLPPRQRTLAIGDSLRTDISGALALGIDGLFVAGGIHAEELGAGGNISADALAAAFAAAGVTPNAVTPRLKW
jgi:HAD superfamily hydrolase (TIGR01459 family)